MPLSDSVLSAAIVAGVQGLGLTNDAVKLKAFIDVIAKETLDHIKSAGVVNVTVVATASGVTTGTASAPVAGTGVGAMT